MPSLRITTHPRIWYSGIPWYQIPLTFPERFGVTSVYDLYIEKTGYFPMVSKQLKSSNSEKLLRLKLFSYSVLESSACGWGKKKNHSEIVLSSKVSLLMPQEQHLSHFSRFPPVLGSHFASPISLLRFSKRTHF